MLDPNVMSQAVSDDKAYSEQASKVVEDQKVLSEDQSQAQTLGQTASQSLLAAAAAIAAELANLPAPPAPPELPSGN
jgi:hypothetical protein